MTIEANGVEINTSKNYSDGDSILLYPREWYGNEFTNCGPIALYAACKFFGKEVDIDKLITASGTEGGITSMEGLRQAAIANGLYAVPVRLSSKEIYKLQIPGIAFVKALEHKDGRNDYHFTFVAKYDGKSFYVVEPFLSHQILQIPKKEFEEAWNGEFLLLSGQKIKISGSAGDIMTNYGFIIILFIMLIAIIVLTRNLWKGKRNVP